MPVLNSARQRYTVLIAGQPVFVNAGSLTINNTIGKRSQARFTVHSDLVTHFQQYEQVAIYDQNNALAFSGYITQPKERKPGFQASLDHTITCVDQHYLADKRIVAAQYTNKTCGYIANDLLTTILSQEGVTLGQIYDGLTPSDTLYPSPTLYPGGNVGLVPSATFAYVTVADALNELTKEASSSGVPYYWQIDQYKQLWFVPYTAVVNSTLIDGSQIEQTRPVTVTHQNPTYRNTEYLLGGVQQTVLQNETRIGDSSTTSWPMNFDLALPPTITVNGVKKSVGLKGTDTGRDFYWQRGTPLITQESSAAKLTGSSTLAIAYIGQYPTVVVSQNNAQIAAQAALDSSTGIVEHVTQDNTVPDITTGFTRVSALLTRYGVQGTLLEFQTLQAGFAQGQLVPVNLPAHQLLNVQMLIEEVQADDSDGLNLWYTVKAVLGPYDTTWIDFFTSLLNQQSVANVIAVGVAQTLTLLASLSVTIAVQATVTAHVYACPIPSTALYPSTTLYPC